jgi:allophanate hydrolase
MAVGDFIAKDPANKDLDPTVAGIISSGTKLSAVDAFKGFDRLAALQMQIEPMWENIDLLILPSIPTTPTVEQVKARPVELNSKMGTYTNFVNLCNMCAIAVPAGRSTAGTPVSITAIAPQFCDNIATSFGQSWEALR